MIFTDAQADPFATWHNGRERAANQPVKAEIATAGTARTQHIARPITQSEIVPALSHITGSWANVRITPAIHPLVLNAAPVSAARPNEAGYQRRQ